LNVETIWQEFLKIVNVEVGSRVVETWFKAVSLFQWDSSKKVAYLQAPNTFVKEWIQTHYVHLLQTHLCRLLNEPRIVVIILEERTLQEQHTPVVQPEIQSKEPSLTTTVIPAKRPIPPAKVTLPAKYSINQHYQFETFVVGPNNSLAYAAAQAIAEKPGLLYNPLFIYGPSGLGKTHLLHAVGNHLRTHNAKMRIVYQSADRFVNEFINAIRFDKITAFEHKYRELDVLLIDDIQFISHKEQTQEAFFHIFNALYESRKQLVFSSDSLPGDIVGLADRLRSRLDGGMIADIHPPTLETKIAILQKKAELHKERLSDDVAHFIASKVSSNIRELEGLLIRVFAFASLTQQAVCLEVAHKVLNRSVKEEIKQTSFDLPYIAGHVAKYYKCAFAELRSSKRSKVLASTRQIAMYFMKKLTAHTLGEIGVFWCRKDHSTVIHALEKVEQQRQKDKHFDQELQKLEELITKSAFSAAEKS
jgi:chromosomal replication initiator protein